MFMFPLGASLPEKRGILFSLKKCFKHPNKIFCCLYAFVERTVKVKPDALVMDECLTCSNLSVTKVTHSFVKLSWDRPVNVTIEEEAAGRVVYEMKTRKYGARAWKTFKRGVSSCPSMTFKDVVSGRKHEFCVVCSRDGVHGNPSNVVGPVLVTSTVRKS